MTDLERRAMLGDSVAQMQCTEQGIAIPCPRCHGAARVWYSTPMSYNNRGFGTYAKVQCTKCGIIQSGPVDELTFDKQTGTYHSENKSLKSVLTWWNSRPEPPVGRCKDCKHYNRYHNCTVFSQEPDQISTGSFVETEPDDFCSYFEPKENASDGC